ncbi:hypothetical protein N9134_00955 [Akkermansiaceae bacterium]|nr:hypothetical protein [Akkermansiaceae bacterium]
MEDQPARLVAVVETEEGPKVDWDAYIRYGDKSWDDVFSGKVEKATVMVHLKPSDYYDHQFSNSEKFSGYAITTPDSDRGLYGYVERDSPLDRALQHSIIAGPGRNTIEISINRESLEYSQVRISGIQAIGWVETRVWDAREN